MQNYAKVASKPRLILSDQGKLYCFIYILSVKYKYLSFQRKLKLNISTFSFFISH